MWQSAGFFLKRKIRQLPSLFGGEAGGEASDGDDRLRNITGVPRLLPGLLLQAVLLPPGLQRGRVLPDGLRGDRLALPVRSYHSVLLEQSVFSPVSPGDLGNGLLLVGSPHPEGAAAVNG